MCVLIHSHLGSIIQMLRRIIHPAKSVLLLVWFQSMGRGTYTCNCLNCQELGIVSHHGAKFCEKHGEMVAQDLRFNKTRAQCLQIASQKIVAWCKGRSWPVVAVRRYGRPHLLMGRRLTLAGTLEQKTHNEREHFYGNLNLATLHDDSFMEDDGYLPHYLANPAGWILVPPGAHRAVQFAVEAAQSAIADHKCPIRVLHFCDDNTRALGGIYKEKFTRFNRTQAWQVIQHCEKELRARTCKAIAYSGQARLSWRKNDTIANPEFFRLNLTRTMLMKEEDQLIFGGFFGVHLDRHQSHHNAMAGEGSNDDVERTARMIFYGAPPLLLQNVLVQKHMYEPGGLVKLYGGAAKRRQRTQSERTELLLYLLRRVKKVHEKAAFFRICAWWKRATMLRECLHRPQFVRQCAKHKFLADFVKTSRVKK